MTQPWRRHPSDAGHSLSAKPPSVGGRAHALGACNGCVCVCVCACLCSCFFVHAAVNTTLRILMFMWNALTIA